jgi:hypothetical protein
VTDLMTRYYADPDAITVTSAAALLAGLTDPGTNYEQQVRAQLWIGADDVVIPRSTIWSAALMQPPPPTQERCWRLPPGPTPTQHTYANAIV